MRNSILKKVLAFALMLTLVITMAPVIPGMSAKAYAEDAEFIDRLEINYTTNSAHPAASAYDLIKEIRAALDGKMISNGTENVAYCSNVYLWEYDNPEFEGYGNQIESDDTHPLDPELYYRVKIEIRANKGFDFKHEGTTFDTSSLATVINGSEMTGVSHTFYNDYWKSININVPIEIDTSDKVYSVDITNSDVNVEAGTSIQFDGKVVSYGEGYDAATWSLEGAESAGTTITADGLLTVAEDESADTITVKLASDKDAEKYDTVTLNVLGRLTIDSVEVSPETVELYTGQSKVITATVTGTHTHEVAWTISGNTSDDTIISPEGGKCTLTIGEKEEAEEITITATSVKDPSKSASATVRVKQLVIIDKLEINFTTENAVKGVSAYELTKELRGAVEYKYISNGTETVGYCINVYLWEYENADLSGSRKQIESADTHPLDPELYYIAEFEIEATEGFDFKHEGSVFDTSSLTAVINGAEMDGVAGNSYNDYWKLIDIKVPIKIVDNTPLDTPTNVKVNNVASSGKPKVTWTAVEDADKYYVYRSTSKNGTYSYLGSTTNTHYTNTGAKAGTTYYYKVKAVNADNEELNSAQSSYCYITCDLAQPTNVKVSNVASSGKPKVTWTAVSGADKYYVYRATSKNGTYSYLGSTTKTSYTNTGAKAGTTYYYKVKAVDSDKSAANSVQSSCCYITCDLAKPTGVKVALSSGKPKVSWTAVSGADKYYVYRATSANGTYSYLGSTTKTSYTNTGAKAGTKYYYKVKAVDSDKSAANSAQSSYVSITSK